MAEDLKDREEIPEGAFLGFVLLKQPRWNRRQFLRDLKADWGISLPQEKGEDASDILYAEIGELKIAVSFLDAPVPWEEVRANAAMNYRWPEAVEVADRHKAQIMVSALGGEDVLERGKLFAKVASSLLRQKQAAAIYTDGMVVSPEFYQSAAEEMKVGGIPLFAWVWFGPYHDAEQSGAYTFGLAKFGRMEMELYLPGGDLPWEKFLPLLGFLTDISRYLLTENVKFDGSETVGISENMRLPLERSEGLAVDGETLKILCAEDAFVILSAQCENV